MKQISNIQENVENALNSLDGIQPANPSPFFYTRLMASIKRKEKNIWEIFGTYISRPRVAFSAICLIILFNGIAIFKKDASSKQALIDQNNSTLTNAYDVAANTANNTILTIWNPENEQSTEK